MQHVPKSSARQLPIASEFTIHEYGALGGGVANASIAEISGRYPKEGWGRNTLCDELVCVISGEGVIETPEQVIRLVEGDVAFVPKGQRIAWNGAQLKVFIPCVPAWRPDQHELLPG